MKDLIILFYTSEKKSGFTWLDLICGLFASQLWKELRPDTPLNGRISKQWCEIGFQGSDPKTDFRGMGLLGLHNLLWALSSRLTPALLQSYFSNQTE